MESNGAGAVKAASGVSATRAASAPGAPSAAEQHGGAATQPGKGNAQTAGVARGAKGKTAASDDEILGLELGVRGRAGSLGEGVAGDSKAGGARTRTVDEILFGDDAAEGDGAARGEDAQRGRDEDTEPGVDDRANDGEAQSAQAPELSEAARAAVEANPELGKLVSEAEAYRGIFPSVEAAREVGRIFPNAEAARAASAQVAELGQIDALFHSNRPETHAELAAAIQRINPRAFQSLTRMMQAVAGAGARDSRGPGSAARGSATDGGELGPVQADERAGDQRGAETRETREAREAREFGRAAAEEQSREAQQRADREAESAQAARAVNQDAQRAFFHEANATAVEGVLGAIRSQVDRLLPEEISEGARKRVVGDIYRELGGALQSTAGFSDRVKGVFGAGRYDAQTRDAVARVIVDQARQSIPGIAKRVINEWTSSVVGTSRARATRQKTAEGRVDIAGGSSGGDGRKSLMPRDVDYRRLSDADILNM